MIPPDSEYWNLEDDSFDFDQLQVDFNFEDLGVDFTEFELDNFDYDSLNSANHE